MNADRMNRWLGFGANLGVIAGLILVAYEIDQSSQQLEISASADGVDNFTQAMEILVQDEALSRFIYRAENAFEELDDFERWRVNRYLDGYMSMSEQDYRVITDIDGGDLNGFEVDIRRYMRMPMYRSYWSESRNRHGPQFQQYVDKILADLENR